MKELLFLLSLLPLAGCAFQRSDPYSGYYVGTAAVVRVTPRDSGLFLVVLGEKNRESSLIGEGAGGVLKAGSGEMVEIGRDSGGYFLRGSGRVDRIERTDSLHYAKTRITLFGGASSRP